jgi:hypothetical protein
MGMHWRHDSKQSQIHCGPGPAQRHIGGKVNETHQDGYPHKYLLLKGKDLQGK